MKYSKKSHAWLSYVLLSLVVVLLVSGCATIILSSSQQVGISSSPTGASVTIDNEPKGETPIVAKLSRKDNHIIKIELEGYEPFEIKTTRSTSGWVWGNIVFGGLIGLAVDAITGGMYIIKPDQIEAELEKKEGSSFLYQKDALYMTVVLSPDPSWQKIGNLKQLEK
jgi:uncharacterized protein YceK